MGDNKTSGAFKYRYLNGSGRVGTVETDQLAFGRKEVRYPFNEILFALSDPAVGNRDCHWQVHGCLPAIPAYTSNGVARARRGFVGREGFVTTIRRCSRVAAEGSSDAGTATLSTENPHHGDAHPVSPIRTPAPAPRRRAGSAGGSVCLDLGGAERSGVVRGGEERSGAERSEAGWCGGGFRNDDGLANADDGLANADEPPPRNQHASGPDDGEFTAGSLVPTGVDGCRRLPLQSRAPKEKPQPHGYRTIPSSRR